MAKIKIQIRDETKGATGALYTLTATRQPMKSHQGKAWATYAVVAYAHKVKKRYVFRIKHPRELERHPSFVCELTRAFQMAFIDEAHQRFADLLKTIPDEELQNEPQDNPA